MWTQRRDAVTQLVTDVLAPSGQRLLVTSRPEGARLEDFLPRFVVLDLAPLSPSQQRAAIAMQLGASGTRFVDRLLSFTEFRAEMDRLYYAEAYARRGARTAPTAP